MTSQLFGATDLHGPHDLEMGGRQSVSATVALPILAKDVSQLWARFLFSCRPPISKRRHGRDPLSFSSAIAAGPRGSPWSRAFADGSGDSAACSESCGGLTGSESSPDLRPLPTDVWQSSAEGNECLCLC